GKTMILKNVAHQAVVRGHTVRFATASDMLADLAAQESSVALARRLRRYTIPHLLCIDEFGRFTSLMIRSGRQRAIDSNARWLSGAVSAPMIQAERVPERQRVAGPARRRPPARGVRPTYRYALRTFGS